MVNRIGGLASGMDIDELVKKIMSAERAPLNKLYQQKQKYEWQRDAYRSVNTKLKTFDNYIADNLVLKDLNSKTATSSNSNLVSVTATGKAAGSLSIEGVSQLASAARLVGDQKNAVGSTKMVDLGATGTIEFKAIQSNGQLANESTKIEVTADMTVDQFITKVNNSNAGISAIFENGRFSFAAKNTGDIKGEDEIQIVNGQDIFNNLGFADPNKVQKAEGKNAIFTVNGIATERTTNNFSISGYNVTLKETFNQGSTIANKYNAAWNEWNNAANNTDFTDLANKKSFAIGDYNAANTNYDGKYNSVFSNASLTEEQQATYNKIKNRNLLMNLTDVNISELRSLNADTSSDAAFQAWLKNATTTEISDDLKTKLTGISLEQFTALKDLDDTSLEKMKSAAELKTYELLGPKFINSLSSDEVNKIKNMLGQSEEQFNASIDALKNSTDEADKALANKLSALNGEQKQALRQLSNTQFDNFKSVATAEIEKNGKLQLKNTAEANETAALNRRTAAEETLRAAYQDYKVQNGSIAGVDESDLGTYKQSVTVPGNTTNAVTMTATTNVDEMMNKIKDFVTTYNGFITDLNDQLKESKYRDYAPLTSEQKEEMSESEIKLWEEKAKSGLLRNDPLIRKGLSDMRSLVYQSNPAITDTKYNTLFSIGITTSENYNDGGTLKIDENKLRKAIEENPDAVEKLFKNSEGKKEDTINGNTVDTRGYLDKLRFESMKSLQINIEKKAGRSTMSDAQYAIGKSLIDTESRIDTWKRKLETVEARYWKQFNAMEQAINKANQQSGMFAQQ
ncbi:flagellar filament capping protein FliD [Lysinibacillus sp. fls2-241-R2A-57]|uniref:flagellar filament capping protein FliD n=1 Tax=Lysinibacillus sp. fls2-241-R2A-57 TaxID=3040292 RepID=UPI0025529CEC|nr:flagellar filament capping protein FliD [Lysinibacillus sp. fls2-241-R2A-57]